jgi:hypothetical protein
VTVSQLITAALQDLRVLQVGETVSANDATFALDRLNDWVNSLANEGLTVYAQARTLWTISTAASYTIGVGGVINCARPTGPMDITNIGFQDTSVSPTIEYNLGPVLTEDAYAGIAQKALTSVYPQAAYYNPTNSTYYNFANGSDTAPGAVASGTADNTAVYNQSFGQGPADVTQAGGLSPYGVMGLGGNVFEWCSTWYTADLNDAEAKEAFPVLKDDNGGQTYRVLRGATCYSSARVDLRSAFRGLGDPHDRYVSNGFRCVLVVAGG